MCKQLCHFSLNIFNSLYIWCMTNDVLFANESIKSYMLYCIQEENIKIIAKTQLTI